MSKRTKLSCQPRKITRVMAALAELLKDGPKSVKEAEQLAETLGVSFRTVHRARVKLGVTSTPCENGGAWVWEQYF